MSVPKTFPEVFPEEFREVFRGILQTISETFKETLCKAFPETCTNHFPRRFPKHSPNHSSFFFVPSSFIPVCVDVTHLHQAGFIYLKQSDLLTCIGIMILLRNSTFMLFNKTINFFNYLDLLIIFFCGI